jgi:hypothetical protein
LQFVLVVKFRQALKTVAMRAEVKYNPYTKKWEDVSPDAVPQVNPMTGKWELAPPNARPKLNPYTNKYEMRRKMRCRDLIRTRGSTRWRHRMRG